jgi:spore coat protein U-like protein
MRFRPLALVALATAARTVSGATIPTTASFTVGATVANGCLVSAAPAQVSGVLFGQFVFSSVSALATATQTITLGNAPLLQCTAGANLRLTLDAGQHAAGQQRRMSNGTAFLPYTVSLTSAGNTPVLPNAEIGIALGATPQPLPLQASIVLTGVAVPAGLYTDTVQVTLAW